MKNMTRRDLCVALPALAAISAGATQAPAAQGHASEFPAPPSATPAAPSNSQAATAAPAAGAGTLGAARAILFAQLPAAATANGGDRRVMLHGKLATGEPVELHQSMQTPGTPAPALHVIEHSEMILVREGTLEFQHEVDGKIVAETAGPGDVFYIAYGTKHAVSNVGSTPARYFVVEIGGNV